MNNTIDRKKANKILKISIERRYEDAISLINETIKSAAMDCENSITIVEKRGTSLWIKGREYPYSFDANSISRYYEKFGFTIETSMTNGYDRRYGETAETKIILSW